jgi:hypothetical protein
MGAGDKVQVLVVTAEVTDRANKSTIDIDLRPPRFDIELDATDRSGTTVRATVRGGTPIVHAQSGT